MNKEAVIVILDCNHTMNKAFTSGSNKQTRFQLAIESVKMLLEQKVSKQSGPMIHPSLL